MPEGRLRPARARGRWRARCSGARSGSSPSTRPCPRPSRRRCSSATSRTTSTTATRPSPSAGPRPSPSTRAQLRELMGEAELRELLDAGALAELEESLLRAAPTPSGCASPDRVHDLLLRAGRPLGRRARGPGRGSGERPGPAPDPSPSRARGSRLSWPSAGSSRVDHRGRGALRGGRRRGAPARRPRRRAAAGAAPGLSRAGAPRPARSRGALRTHPRAVPRRRRGARLGCGEALVETALGELLADGRVVEGEFRPGGSGREWVSPDVLASLRQRSLAKLRARSRPPSPRPSRAPCSTGRAS